MVSNNTYRMKHIYLLLLFVVPTFAFGQLKEIAFAELSAGSGMYFGAQMTPTTITVTVQGPADRFIAFGFGTGMATGNDAIIWSTLGTGAAPLQLRDHRMIGSGVEPSVDAQQDWTEISNNVAGGNRTIVASRALSTGDANDVTFSFAATTQNLFWAKGPSATNQLQYHGGSNRASGIVRNWVTVDQTPPVVNTLTPNDNANGVGLTQNLIMNFNENISWGTGSIRLYDGSNTLIQTISNGSPGVGLLGSTLNWNPTANFVVNTQYYVQVDATALKDAAGNFYAGISDNVTWNFNTNDITAPVLIASPFVPADNSAGVSVSQNLSIVFNENIQAGTGFVNLFDAANNVIEAFDLEVSPQVSFSGATLTINPTSDLTPNTSYYVLVQNGAIEDLSGNGYAGFSDNTTWNFNTNDVVAPSLLGFTPSDDAVNVAVNPTIEMTFNEDVFIGATGALQLWEEGSGMVESFTSANANISATANVVSITLAGDLNENSGYYFITVGDIIEDIMGNNYTGINDTTTWNFTTGDFTAPGLASSNAFDPADNATDVPVNATLSIAFNEDIVLGTGMFVLTNETTSGTEEFSLSAGNISIAGNTVIMTPATDLDGLTGYHITATVDAVQDGASNAFAGISNTGTWNFVTESGAGLDELAQNGIHWNGSILTFKTNDVPVANIYDATGKLVLKELKQQTDCSALPSGVYLLTINRDEKFQTIRLYVE